MQPLEVVNASAYVDGGLGSRDAHPSDLTLLYQFAKDRTLAASDRLGPTLAITRATTGTFFDAQGVLQTAAAGVARFDYDPVTGESLGLLVEEARTNLVLQSQDVSASPWTTLVTPVINIDSSIAPDGTLTMNSINDNNGAGFEGVVQQITIPNDSATYTFSMYIEKTAAGTAPTMGVNIVLIGGTNPGDLPIPRIFTDTGFVQDLQAGTNSRIEDAGDYWRLITTVDNNSTGNITYEIQIFPATANNGFLPNIVGATGINRVWGMQVEVGSFATSYIPTTTATVTRNADVVNTTDVNWVNENGGTFYTKASVLSIDVNGNNNRILSLNDGSNSDIYDLFVVNTTGVPRFLSTHSSDTDASINGTALVAKVASHFAFAYADDDFALFQDGISQGTDTAAAVPLNAVIAEFNVGSRQTAVRQLNGHIAELRYYNVGKDAQFLEDLSNGLISE